jgi:hypothetical protein
VGYPRIQAAVSVGSRPSSSGPLVMRTSPAGKAAGSGAKFTTQTSPVWRRNASRRGPQRLAFRRQTGLVCVVNFAPDPAALPAGDVLLASGPLDDNRLPADTAAWIRG